MENKIFFILILPFALIRANNCLIFDRPDWQAHQNPYNAAIDVHLIAEIEALRLSIIVNNDKSNGVSLVHVFQPS
ncbi:hypothetical protein OPS25_09475 [Alteromonas ponticola]|uniref:Uncharacterized protein n=1 Tax=Alteromonas aquimaris TaxID=2998417 RepID=A0ABT3P7K2_9ALTE|nr:hypothetical protein [Alteromonas aquimaris]MCW8108725.1 hypothetical protein [Alteromonas aquimaris]